MTVFICHSSKDTILFNKLIHALESEKFPFWQLKNMRGGVSVRDQLRTAIGTCDLCVFLATKSSLNSDWCRTELGAFWGASKKIIVYIADASINGKDLPEPFKGDLWFRELPDVVQELKKTFGETAATRKTTQQKNDTSSRVGDLTVSALLELLKSSPSDSTLNSPYSEILDRLALLVSSKIDHSSTPTAGLSALLTRHLEILIGESVDLAKEHGKGKWPHSFELSTSTGVWAGFSAGKSLAAGGDVELNQGCLLIRVEGRRIESAVVVAYVNEIGISRQTTYDVGPVLAHGGRKVPGEATSLASFQLRDNLELDDASRGHNSTVTRAVRP